jgi:hypothetical protein
MATKILLAACHKGIAIGWRAILEREKDHVADGGIVSSER